MYQFGFSLQITSEHNVDRCRWQQRHRSTVYTSLSPDRLPQKGDGPREGNTSEEAGAVPHGWWKTSQFSWATSVRRRSPMSVCSRVQGGPRGTGFPPSPVQDCPLRTTLWPKGQTGWLKKLKNAKGIFLCFGWMGEGSSGEVEPFLPTYADLLFG